MSKMDLVYVVYCLLLDASDVLFGMRILRASTFCKRLARKTDERWNRSGWSIANGDTEEAK